MKLKPNAKISLLLFLIATNSSYGASLFKYSGRAVFRTARTARTFANQAKNINTATPLARGSVNPLAAYPFLSRNSRPIGLGFAVGSATTYGMVLSQRNKSFDRIITLPSEEEYLSNCSYLNEADKELHRVLILHLSQIKNPTALEIRAFFERFYERLEFLGSKDISEKDVEIAIKFFTGDNDLYRDRMEKYKGQFKNIVCKPADECAAAMVKIVKEEEKRKMIEEEEEEQRNLQEKNNVIFTSFVMGTGVGAGTVKLAYYVKNWFCKT